MNDVNSIDDDDDFNVDFDDDDDIDYLCLDNSSLMSSRDTAIYLLNRCIV